MWRPKQHWGRGEGLGVDWDIPISLKDGTDKLDFLYPDLSRNLAMGGKTMKHILGCGQGAREGGEKRKLCPSPCWDGCWSMQT